MSSRPSRRSAILDATVFGEQLTRRIGSQHRRSSGAAGRDRLTRGARPRCRFFAFAYNALGVPIAAGLLYPWTGWLLSPMLASAAMSLSSVSVIANALRLRRVDL